MLGTDQIGARACAPPKAQQRDAEVMKVQTTWHVVSVAMVRLWMVSRKLWGNGQGKLNLARVVSHNYHHSCALALLTSSVSKGTDNDDSESKISTTMSCNVQTSSSAAVSGCMDMDDEETTIYIAYATDETYHRIAACEPASLRIEPV